MTHVQRRTRDPERAISARVAISPPATAMLM